ncbi:hypothetical protein G6F65_021170 [Rhizopus arrhizus]|nr:hypothetical protein G6F65_021170 [Rhizopus arrhizus]
MEFDLLGVALHGMPPHRHHLADQLRQPAAARGIDRRPRQQRRRRGHHIAHIALDVDAAFHVVLPQNAHGAFGQMGQRHLVVRHEPNPRIGRPPHGAVRQNQLDRDGQGLKLAFHNR